MKTLLSFLGKSTLSISIFAAMTALFLYWLSPSRAEVKKEVARAQAEAYQRGVEEAKAIADQVRAEAFREGVTVTQWRNDLDAVDRGLAWWVKNEDGLALLQWVKPKTSGNTHTQAWRIDGAKHELTYISHVTTDTLTRYDLVQAR